MDEGNVTVLVDAKEEYTKQLISILKSCIYQGIKSIYMDAKDICNQDNTPDNVLMIFQDLLSRIPKWSQDIINKEFERIVNFSKCDYIDDLLKVVYVSHIKILTIVHSSHKNKKISLKVPSGSHFIHLCYIECAREFWKDPYFFSDRVTKYELQKNMRDSESMIAECIMETIRKQLPVRNILKEFLNEADEDIAEEDDEDIKEPLKKKYMKKLETVIKKELKTSNKTNEVGEIDIELIRKVIREELNSRPESTTIKKELVDTVVEKIVEQAQEAQESIEESIISENITDKSNTEVKVEAKVEEKAKDNTVEEKAKDNTVEEAKAEDKADTVSLESTSNNTKEEGKLEGKIETTNSPITNLETTNFETTNSDTSKSYNNEESENEGTLDNLLDSDDNMKAQTEQRKTTLSINNIDEVNLNLDELDNDLDNEIDLEELQTVDISSKSNSSNSSSNNSSSSSSSSSSSNSSKDPNTKYIFFKDVA